MGHTKCGTVASAAKKMRAREAQTEEEQNSPMTPLDIASRRFRPGGGASCGRYEITRPKQKGTLENLTPEAMRENAVHTMRKVLGFSRELRMLVRNEKFTQ